MDYAPPPFEIGIGVDVARYQHVVRFVNADRQPVRKTLLVPESREGYNRFAQALDDLTQKHKNVLFRCVLDDAGVYGRNLRSFLQSLPHNIVITTANPLLNRHYKKAFLQDNKNDDIDAQFVARFAASERPAPSAPMDPIIEQLKMLCSRLRSQKRQTIRSSNQMHWVLATSFPEFASLFRKITSDTARALLRKYPTAEKAARASVKRLARFQSAPGARPLGEKKAAAFVLAAKDSVASFNGPAAEHMTRDLLDQIELFLSVEKRLVEMIADIYEKYCPNRLLSIPGVGAYSAGVYTAFIGDIQRFPSPEKLVGYFGVYPVDNQSGIQHGRSVMSSKGNDIVRQALFMNAVSGIQCNPILRDLYERKIAEGKCAMVALGHCMRKLLHIIYVVLSRNEPFAPNPSRKKTTPSEANISATECDADNTNSSDGEEPMRADGYETSDPSATDRKGTRCTASTTSSCPDPETEKASGAASVVNATTRGQRSPEGFVAHHTPLSSTVQSHEKRTPTNQYKPSRKS